MISEEKSEHLKRHGKKVLSIEEIPQWLFEIVITGTMDERHNQLDEIVAVEVRNPPPVP